MSKITGIILNIIGATFRFAFGTIWRTISNKHKFQFEQYKRGSIISNEWINIQKHTHANKIIGFLFLVIIFITIKYVIQ